LSVARRGLNGRCVPQIGLYGMDLPDVAEWLQVPGQFGSPHGNPDPVVAFGKGTNHVAAEKSRSAVNGDKGVVGAACAHAALGSRVKMPENPANTGLTKVRTEPEIPFIDKL
jgi:hypothetical protein